MNILVIEPECKGWNHEQVNSEFLNMISQYYPDDAICFCAEKEHLDNIRRCKELLNVKYRKIVLPTNAGDTMKYWKYYLKLIGDLLIQSKYQRVILLSSHKGNIQAINYLAERYRDVQFVITLHALVEQLLRHYTLRDRLLNDKFFHGWKLKKLLNQSTRKGNIRYITYSPSLKDKLSTCLKRQTLDNIFFLNHPYPYMEKTQNEIHEGLVIGLLGATINDNAEKIISIVEKACPKERYKFKLLRVSKRFEKYEHVEIVQNGGILSREIITQEMKNVDYLMIPYDRTMYGLSASGVFFDAVNYEIPVLMLDSPLLTWYDQKYNLGIRMDSCESLAQYIIDLIINQKKVDWDKYHNNMKRAKVILQQENVKLLDCMWREG